MSEVVVSSDPVATICYMAEEHGPAFPLYQRVLREKSMRGWTWTQLQAETGLARSTFNSWKTQPQPPQPRTINEIADKLGIDRADAMRLAGVLADADELTPQCVVERVVLETEDLPIEMKRDFVRVHRIKGHTVDCNPYPPGESQQQAAPLASLSAAAV